MFGALGQIVTCKCCMLSDGVEGCFWTCSKFSASFVDGMEFPSSMVRHLMHRVSTSRFQTCICLFYFNKEWISSKDCTRRGWVGKRLVCASNFPESLLLTMHVCPVMPRFKRQRMCNGHGKDSGYLNIFQSTSRVNISRLSNLENLSHS